MSTQFFPRIADLPETRLWRARPRKGKDGTRAPAKDYGALDEVSGHTVDLERIAAHREDVLVAGSLITGERAHDVIRMLAHEGSPTVLGHALIGYGRLFKAPYVLRTLHDESYRRMTGARASPRYSMWCPRRCTGLSESSGTEHTGPPAVGTASVDSKSSSACVCRHPNHAQRNPAGTARCSTPARAYAKLATAALA